MSQNQKLVLSVDFKNSDYDVIVNNEDVYKKLQSILENPKYKEALEELRDLDGLCRGLSSQKSLLLRIAMMNPEILQEAGISFFLGVEDDKKNSNAVLLRTNTYTFTLTGRAIYFDENNNATLDRFEDFFERLNTTKKRVTTLKFKNWLLRDSQKVIIYDEKGNRDEELEQELSELLPKHNSQYDLHMVVLA